MAKEVVIVTLAENTARGAELLGEHGLSFSIKINGTHLLFDTGQGKVLFANAHHLGIDLCAVEKVVLSHGHYDHTGGLHKLLQLVRDADVYVHPMALKGKYVQQDKPPHRSIGIPDLNEGAIRSLSRNLVWTTRATVISDAVCVTGEIPRHTDFENVGGPYYLDEPCTQPDPLTDDQSLFIETARGLVVLLGCAHSGVVNTLHYISALTGQTRMYAVIGGMHLINASNERLRETVKSLESHGVEIIAPCHCTGMAAMTFLRTHLPSRVVECTTGSKFNFKE